MAKLFIKNPYIQCGGSQGADGYMKYIATRERWRTFRTTAHPKAGTAHHKDGTRFP